MRVLGLLVVGHLGNILLRILLEPVHHLLGSGLGGLLDGLPPVHEHQAAIHAPLLDHIGICPGFANPGVPTVSCLESLVLDCDDWAAEILVPGILPGWLVLRPDECPALLSP